MNGWLLCRRCVNVSHAELRELLGGAVGGLHTMTDEHFGISIVEYMAAGEIKQHAEILPVIHHPLADFRVPCLNLLQLMQFDERGGLLLMP